MKRLLGFLLLMVLSLTSVAGNASSDAKTEKSSVEFINLDSEDAVFLSDSVDLSSADVLSVESASKLTKVEKEKSKAIYAGFLFTNSKRLVLRHPEYGIYANRYDYTYFPYTKSPLIPYEKRQNSQTRFNYHSRC